MKTTKKELLDCLDAVKPGLAAKEMITQATCFVFYGGRVRTYNDEISISAPAPFISAMGAVQADELFKLITKMKKEEMELEFADEELRISSGRCKAGITLSAEIKLPLNELSAITEWVKVPEKFRTALNFCHWSCSRDMSAAVLTCLNISPEGFVEASDNMRIVRFNLDSSFPAEKAFLIPGTVAKVLAGYDIELFCLNEGWAHFKTKDDVIFSCRIFSETFPEIAHFFDVRGKEFQLPRTMKEVLDRAGIFSKGKMEQDEQITVKMADKRMTIRGEGATGWYEEELNVKYSDAPVQFTISPYLLNDILGNVSKAILTDNFLLFEGENWKYITLLELSR